MSRTIKIVSIDGDFSGGNHDVALDGVGRFVMLSGEAKLIEDIQKILFTEENQFWDKYGTQIDDLIGTNIGVNEIKQLLGQRVAASLVYLQFLQQEQRRYQNCQAAELISAINNISVTYLGEVSKNPQDLFKFVVAVSVVNAVGSNINVTQSFNLAGTQ